ncbi:hypothetical protein PIROE2DRAFT_63872 [Piromyces sp. E2]|nr:hypothetical protein PIROE2DRAFT_63872 [Piromyces sp. E2]|eukprot:OUM59273.1 hypothetical protein PIROE2DRAFT_63872 [Piromyces sp. E2]
MEIAVSQNALRHQLNLEGESEKNTPVLLQLLKTLDIQDINLEEYVINEKHTQLDAFEAFKQKQLSINDNDSASSSKSEKIPVIMTSEMKTEKNKNPEEGIENENEQYDKGFEEEFKGEFEGDFEDEDVEEVSLLDIQNNSLISNDEILKESKIIEEAEAEAAAKSLQNEQNISKGNNEDANTESILDSLKEEENQNKYNVEEDSEIDFVTEMSTKDEDNNDTVNSLSENLDEDDSEKFGEYPLPSEIDDPSEIRKQATKSLIHDIKLQLEHETIEKTSETKEKDVATDEIESQEQQISIDDLNMNKNIR